MIKIFREIKVHTKAELPKVGFFFHIQFPSQGIFINKKVGNRKT